MHLTRLRKKPINRISHFISPHSPVYGDLGSLKWQKYLDDVKMAAFMSVTDESPFRHFELPRSPYIYVTLQNRLGSNSRSVVLRNQRECELESIASNFGFLMENKSPGYRLPILVTGVDHEQ